ncbi:MAG TPA: immunoglobulin domain-containing protein, partial [Verrucomicrobiae bacterium]|nr:immunoglobulin domain-containing protein [Verrucomicrobiae bacterium]
TNSTSIGVAFNNSGTVTALEGTIAYGAGISLTNGTLNFAINSPSTFGRMSISGAVNLTGSVGAVLLDGYVPTVGAQFNVLTFGSATGAFTDYSGLNVGSGIALNPTTSPTTLTLQAAATNFVAVTPAVITQPMGQTVTYGSTVTLTALVSGSAPLLFQWNQNGVPVAGGTDVGLTLSNVLVSQAGSYTLSVTNPAGGAISQPAILNVLKLTPVLTWGNPAGISYGTPIGSSQLNASANVPGTFVYNPPSGTILNAGANTLSVTFTPTDAVDYASAAGSVSMAVSKVPLSAIANNASRAYGQTNPVFSGTITGLINSDNITENYNCSATPTSKPGAYPIVPVLVDPNGRLGNYSITLTNGSLTVNPGPPPTLDGISPNLGPTTGGTTVTILGNGFETGATVAFGSLSASSVSVTATNSLTAVTPISPAGLVNVTVTNADGNTVTLTNAFTYGVPPGIQDQPYNQSILPGQTVQFPVQATGASPLAYQWQFNGANLLDFAGISGSHTATLTISNVSLSRAGSYSVIITNAFGTAVSSTATLTILELPSITTQPQGLAAGAGANVNFSVLATGTQPLSYQWYQNGGPVGGATASVLNIPSVQSGSQGNYTVMVTNIAGSVTSAPAPLNLLAYCASAQASQAVYPAGTTVPLSIKTFNCSSSVAVPNSAAVVWLYEAGSSRSFPVVTDGSGNSTFNFVPFPGEVGVCQFAAALPGQSAPAAQGSFTLVGMSLSAQSATPQLIVGVPLTNTIILSNLTGLELSGISTTVVGQPGDVSVQVIAP